MTKTDFARAEVVPLLPKYFRPDEGDPVPDELAGATILQLGSLPAGSQVEGGGLVIDFIPEGGTAPRRVVFGFNELGMWVEFLEGREIARSVVPDAERQLSAENEGR